MPEKKNRDSYPTIVKAKKKGIAQRKPPNDKIISYKLIDAEEKEESKINRNDNDDKTI